MWSFPSNVIMSTITNFFFFCIGTRSFSELKIPGVKGVGFSLPQDLFYKVEIVGENDGLEFRSIVLEISFGTQKKFPQSYLPTYLQLRTLDPVSGKNYLCPPPDSTPFLVIPLVLEGPISLLTFEVETKWLSRRS